MKRQRPRSGSLGLARSFLRPGKQTVINSVASATIDHHSVVANATRWLGCYPALKDRAKLMQPLRGEEPVGSFCCTSKLNLRIVNSHAAAGSAVVTCRPTLLYYHFGGCSALVSLHVIAYVAARRCAVLQPRLSSTTTRSGSRHLTAAS